MLNATSAMPAGPSPKREAPRVSEFRVIYHEPVCPDCGSTSITSAEVETGDGLTETAHICADCGAAWPLACICDWTTRPEPAREHLTRR
jgi:ribosomal protein S27AE